MERLYLDTNVLFPMTLMDLMLSMVEDFHHEPTGLGWVAPPASPAQAPMGP